MARALYIHWPFCLAKCPYCDFNSHVRDRVDHAAWQAALLADMAYEAEHAGRASGSGPLDSVFFGGGTPSLMPPALVERLLDAAERLWGFAPDIEITLEGNPSSVEAAAYADLARAGVNRASLGLQALDDAALRFLGRLHDADEGLAALAVAQRHFARVSFDLIYARPEQTPEAWDAELARALALGTGHLSLYQLTFEPGTRFATLLRAGAVTPLDDDTAADLFALTRERTAAAGLPAYEVSNHARSGEESRHNLTYWRYGDYAGVGPGAHGRRDGLAVTRRRKPENWLAAVDRNGHGIEAEEPLAPHDRATEALLMGLRLREGVDVARVAALAGGTAPIDWRAIDRLEAQGFLARDGDRLRVREAGALLLDAILPQVVTG